MKRILAGILCMILVLGLLPMEAGAVTAKDLLPLIPRPSVKTSGPSKSSSGPSRAVSLYSAYISVNVSEADIGDTLTWEVNGVVADGTPYYQFDVYRQGVLDSGYEEYLIDWTWSTENYFSMTVTQPGWYTVEVWVNDTGADDWSNSLWGPNYGVETYVYYPMVQLPTPKITGVTAVSGTSLKITWKRSAGAKTHVLFRSTSKTGPYTYVKDFTTATSYTNTYRKAGTRYYYIIFAYTLHDNYIEVSNDSAPVAGVPLAKSAITKATGVSRTQVKLTWKKVTGASGYQIFRSATAGGTYKLIKSTTALSYTAGGMQHAKTYYFKVKPYKKIGTLKYYGPLSAYRAGRTK